MNLHDKLSRSEVKPGETVSAIFTNGVSQSGTFPWQLAFFAGNKQSGGKKKTEIGLYLPKTLHRATDVFFTMNMTHYDRGLDGCFISQTQRRNTNT